MKKWTKNLALAGFFLGMFQGATHDNFYGLRDIVDFVYLTGSGFFFAIIGAVIGLLIDYLNKPKLNENPQIKQPDPIKIQSKDVIKGLPKAQKNKVTSKKVAAVPESTLDIIDKNLSSPPKSNLEQINKKLYEKFSFLDHDCYLLPNSFCVIAKSAEYRIYDSKESAELALAFYKSTNTWTMKNLVEQIPINSSEINKERAQWPFPDGKKP
jgi:hypothetical protein